MAGWARKRGWAGLLGWLGVFGAIVPALALYGWLGDGGQLFLCFSNSGNMASIMLRSFLR